MSQGGGNSPCQGQNCYQDQETTATSPYIEQKVVLFFRLWHMIFLCSGGVLAIIILLCCCFKCRIPRTKQEIESDFRRRKVTRKFRRELNQMAMEEIDVKDIRSVLDKVRDKFSRKYSFNNTDGQDEEGGGPSAFAGFKLRLLNMFSMKKQSKKNASEENPDAEKPTEDKLNDENPAV